MPNVKQMMTPPRHLKSATNMEVTVRSMLTSKDMHVVPFESICIGMRKMVLMLLMLHPSQYFAARVKAAIGVPAPNAHAKALLGPFENLQPLSQISLGHT